MSQEETSERKQAGKPPIELIKEIYVYKNGVPKTKSHNLYSDQKINEDL